MEQNGLATRRKSSATLDRRRASTAAAPIITAPSIEIHSRPARPLCVFCGKNFQQRRGLCASCRRIPERYATVVRPGDANYQRSGETPPTPTAATPGSEEKIVAMAARVDAGLTVDHPGDLKWKSIGNVTPRETPADARIAHVSRGAAALQRREGGGVRGVAADGDPGDGPDGGDARSGVTSERMVQGRKIPSVAWRRWLPDSPTRANISAAIEAHVGKLDGEDDDRRACDSWRSMAVDEFYFFPKRVRFDDSHATKSINQSVEDT